MGDFFLLKSAKRDAENGIRFVYYQMSVNHSENEVHQDNLASHFFHTHAETSAYRIRKPKWANACSLQLMIITYHCEWMCNKVTEFINTICVQLPSYTYTTITFDCGRFMKLDSCWVPKEPRNILLKLRTNRQQKKYNLWTTKKQFDGICI